MIYWVRLLTTVFISLWRHPQHKKVLCSVSDISTGSYSVFRHATLTWQSLFHVLSLPHNCIPAPCSWSLVIACIVAVEYTCKTERRLRLWKEMLQISLSAQASHYDTCSLSLPPSRSLRLPSTVLAPLLLLLCILYVVWEEYWSGP